MSFQESKRRLIILFTDDLKLYSRNETGLDLLLVQYI